MRLVCSLVLLLGGLQLTYALLVGAWNIQILGKTKAKEFEIMNLIAGFVKDYDIILIQELRDQHPTQLNSVTRTLMNLVNQGPQQYNHIYSEPLGISSCHKERYLYIYNTATVSVVGNGYQYPDNNVFSRPPFVVKFSSNIAATQYVLIPLHSRPDFAVQEIGALVNVVAAVNTHWNNLNQNILLLGDFNAGCRYVTHNDWALIPLRTDANFHWLIPDNAATNVASIEGTGCAYDRIVANNAMMMNQHVVTADVFNFAAWLGINQDEALQISDHFPVWVKLQP